jgi:hypothetical protein
MPTFQRRDGPERRGRAPLPGTEVPLLFGQAGDLRFVLGLHRPANAHLGRRIHAWDLESLLVIVEAVG